MNWEWAAYNAPAWVGPLFIATGGGLGAAVRYVLSTAINNWHQEKIIYSPKPLLSVGTIIVNVIGSFVIGVLVVAIGWMFSFNLGGAWDANSAWQKLMGLLLVTGLCGGFTTFSTATVEAVALARQGEWRRAIASVAITLGGSLVAVTFGVGLTDGIVQWALLR